MYRIPTSPLPLWPCLHTQGIEANVHTYSALMNVCIKANELDLAEDVYKQMVDEGCIPNLVWLPLRDAG